MEERPFSCDLCSKTFRRKCTYDQHLLSHKDVENCSSNDSEEECSDNIKFAPKKREKKIFMCEVCKLYFYTKNSLDVHLLIHAGKKPFICNECHRKFAQESDLENHSRVHTPEAKFNHKICNEKNTSKGKLKNHLLIHTEKLNACVICEKQFKSKRTLQNHYRSHRGEKPYECNICKKMFAKKKSLILHGLSHSKEKPYTSDESRSLCLSENKLPNLSESSDFFCNKCEKKFPSQQLADNHLCNPVKEKFICEKCNSVFSVLKNLKCHIQYNHNKTRRIVCNLCKREFLSKHHLDLHSCPSKC